MAHLTARSRSTVDCVDQAIDERIDGLTDWLADNCPYCTHEQAHLDAGTRERAYWHYGYLTALRDLRDLRAGRRTSLN
jgi:hypothetical protein